MEMSRHLRYTKDYKYRLADSYWIFTNYRPKAEIRSGDITLTPEGLLFVRAGYSSDGPSGPTIDTKNFMPGATGFHDPIYELLRKGLMDKVKIQEPPAGRLGLTKGVYEYDGNEHLDNLRDYATPYAIRHEADKKLVDINLELGMWVVRARWVYLGLRVGGASSADKPRKIHEAP